MLNYLNFTRHLGCRPWDSDGTVGLHVYCDALFAVHPDAKSVGGVYASLGTGPIWCKCGKQKLVSRSSTEAELVALSDGVSLALWTKSFLEEQGYKVRGELYEDNQSTNEISWKWPKQIWQNQTYQYQILLHKAVLREWRTKFELLSNS